MRTRLFIWIFGVGLGKMGGQRNFTDYLNTNMIPLTHPKVRIVLFNTIVMELMGTDLILPCKAVGSPKPDIFWIDANNEQIISNQDPRFKVRKRRNKQLEHCVITFRTISYKPVPIYKVYLVTVKIQMITML